MAAYIALWKPAWDWILHVYAQGATRENTLETLREYASLRPAAQAVGDGGGVGGSYGYQFWGIVPRRSSTTRSTCRLPRR